LILAVTVGAASHVMALEIDQWLAERARRHLSDLAGVEVTARMDGLWLESWTGVF
jgi:protein-L-isoaspartate O-methyltransferase